MPEHGHRIYNSERHEDGRKELGGTNPTHLDLEQEISCFLSLCELGQEPIGGPEVNANMGLRKSREGRPTTIQASECIIAKSQLNIKLVNNKY